MNFKKSSCFYVSIVLFSLYFIGCTNHVTTVNNNKITILGENSATMLALIRDSGAYMPTNGYQLVFKPVNYEDTLSTIINNFNTTDGINDIVLLYNFSFPEIINSNLVYNYDSLVQNESKDKFNFVNDIFPSAWQEAGSYFHSVGGHENQPTKINYPVAMNTMVLVYNKAMFEDVTNQTNYEKLYNKKLLPPTTWIDFYNIANFFTDAQKGTYGIAMQGAVDGYLYYEFCNYFFGMGAKVFDKTSGWQGTATTPIIVNNDLGLKATEYYKSLKPFNNGDFINVDAVAQNKFMKEGKTAMALVWSDYLTYFALKDNGQWDTQFGYATIPGNISPLQGAFLFVNKKSPAAQEAAKYILFCLQKSNQIELVKKGLSSPQKSVYDDPQIKAIPYSDAVKQCIERGAYMFEYGPDVNLVSQTITKNIQNLWLDKITPKQAVDNIKNEIEAARLKISFP
ncbi:MAG: extracellular solute-binding protein [Alphaproteobacteria bacterium]|nr:extracellular solute-binding protein [Alphaproteobacteria bacterium]